MVDLFKFKLPKEVTERVYEAIEIAKKTER